LGKQKIQFTGEPCEGNSLDRKARYLHHNAQRWGVIQGLSEVPFMQGVEQWGVLTIGTGLGNARFSNRNKDKRKPN